MKYVLQDLLQVRQFREDGAATAVTRQRLRVDEAQKTVEDRRRELAEYTQWRIAQEKKLYDDIIDHRVQMKDLDDLKLKIQSLRDRELTFQDSIRLAEQELVNEQKKLLDSQHAHREAVKNREKLEEHKGMWLVEVEREVENGMEKELEDFHSKTPDFDEEVDEYEDT
ncbi:MAG: type III secretion protein [Fuerstiella sp.]|nr:type III secretion protein [Fuerstiella sp.]